MSSKLPVFIGSGIVKGILARLYTSLLQELTSVKEELK